MKTLIIALGLLTFGVACNNNTAVERQEEVNEAERDFTEEKHDAKQEYDKQLQEAKEDRADEMNDVKHDAIDARDEEVR